MSLIDRENLLNDLGLEGIGKVKGIKWQDDKLRKIINEQREVDAIPVKVTQEIDNMNNPLEPLKVYSAFQSEMMKLNIRKEKCPDQISILDYTIIYALYDILKRNGSIMEEDE